MKKLLLSLLVVAFAATGASASHEQAVMREGGVSSMIAQTPAAKIQDRFPDKKDYLVQVQATPSAPATKTQTTTSATFDAPGTTTTTVIKGGDLAAKVLDWMYVAFGSTISAAILALIYKVFGYFGIQTTQMQRDQLQQIIVNGLNAGAAKAGLSLASNKNMDIQVKNQIVAQAIEYTQAHAPETIKALGLDPKSGDAVEAIRARIETALNDPKTPTPAVITPDSGMPNQPLAPKI